MLEPAVEAGGAGTTQATSVSHPAPNGYGAVGAGFTPPEFFSPEEWQGLLARLHAGLAARPEDRLASRRLALALYNVGEFDEAEELYRRLLAEKDEPVLRNRLASVLRDKGELQAAEAMYREVLGADPALGAAYVNLAELLWRLGREDEALALLDEGKGMVAEEARAGLEQARSALTRGLAPAGSLAGGLPLDQ